MGTFSALNELIKEGTVSLCDMTGVPLIGETGGGDPLTHCTNIEPIGYIERGTINIALTRTYADLKSGTPAKFVRKDLTEKTAMVTFNSVQINDADLWAIRDGLLVKKNYNDTGFLGDLGQGGTDEVVLPRKGLLLQTKDVNGVPYNWLGYSTINVAEDLSEARSGDAHVTVPLSFLLFPDPSFDPQDESFDIRNTFIKWNDKS